MRKYYYIVGQERVGPLTLLELKLVKGFTPGTLVWYDGLPAWVRAGEVSELSSVFASSEPPPLPGEVVPPPLPHSPLPHAERKPRVDAVIKKICIYIKGTIRDGCAFWSKQPAKVKRYCIAGAIVFVCIAVVVGGILMQPRYKADSYVKKGDQFHRSGYYREAMEWYGKAIVEYPTADVYCRMSQTYSATNCPAEQVIDCYQKAINLAPNHIEAHFKMGLAYHNSKKYDKAILCYQKCIDIDPNHAEAHYNMGVNYDRLKEYNEAILCCQKAVAINPNHAQAHIGMGNAYLDLKEYNESILCYQKAVAIDPKNAAAHYNMGNAYGKLKNYTQAILCCQKCIDIDPNHAAAHYNMGNTYGKLKNYTQAIACYQKCIDINPNHAAAHHNMGRGYGELKKYNQAIACYQKSIDINPRNADVHINMGNAYLKLEQYAQAIACFQRAARLGNDPARQNLRSSGYSW
jgi:tetratricopeptide (TPR) repeat protein